jgi:hypothetical protein
MIHPLAMLDDGKHRRPALTHLRGIALHNSQISPDSLGKINLVHNEQVRPRNARSALARHLVTPSHINNIDDVVRELARVVGGEVVASGLDEEEVGLKLLLELLQGEQVCADVLADGRVRAAACFDCSDAVGGEGFIAGEEFGIFAVLSPLELVLLV